MTRVAFPLMLAALALALHPPGLAAGPQDQADAARRFLAAHLDMSPADFRKLDQGLVVAHVLDAADKREVATRAVVRMRVAADLYLERLSDIVAFKRHEAVQQIGVFTPESRSSDLGGLTLDRGDLRALRACRAGDCDLNLPASAIARFQREVSWGAPEADTQATAVMRDVLARFVAAYRREGSAAAMMYENDREPVDTAAEFRSLLASDGSLLDQFPGLAQHTLEYPRAAAPNVRELFYWSKEKPGPSPSITITHVIMWPVQTVSPGSPVRHAILSRQIYGSRYFDASMGLTLLLPDPSDPAAASYVVYRNRSRLDAFGGLFGGLIRRTVRGRVRSGMAESLARVKAAMERLQPGQEGSPRYPPTVSAAQLHQPQAWRPPGSVSTGMTSHRSAAGWQPCSAAPWRSRPGSPRSASSSAVSVSISSPPNPCRRPPLSNSTSSLR
jgi:hypothetical protein